MVRKIGDLCVIFLASNMPGQEENWQDLLAKCPRARRLEGGGAKADADAYAAAAVRATSPTFITVEGDCVVDEEFFSARIDAGLPGEDRVLVWAIRNSVNNLCYEHGAMRCWPRPLALSGGGQAPGSEVPTIVVAAHGYGTHRINASPESAFGHGFGEGVRLSTLNGRRVAEESDFHGKPNGKRPQGERSPGSFPGAKWIHHQNWRCLGSTICMKFPWLRP